MTKDGSKLFQPIRISRKLRFTCEVFQVDWLQRHRKCFYPKRKADLKGIVPRVTTSDWWFNYHSVTSAWVPFVFHCSSVPCSANSAYVQGLCAESFYSRRRGLHKGTACVLGSGASLAFFSAIFICSSFYASQRLSDGWYVVSKAFKLLILPCRKVNSVAFHFHAAKDPFACEGLGDPVPSRTEDVNLPSTRSVY